MIERNSLTVKAIARGVTFVALFGMTAMLADDARGEGVAQVMTEKSLPDATVDVIDPESGTSAGTSGSDVKLAAGDIILFRFAFTPVPDKVNRGMQHWLTEYIPANTEVVGVRIIDENGNTIIPKYPGIAVDGCHGGSTCNGSSYSCDNTGTGSCEDGSIAQIVADTGVFFSTDARTARTPSDVFLTTDNGIEMSAEPLQIDPALTKLIGDDTGPWYAHNAWDYMQVRGFGASSSPNSGTGNTPHLYGSPVAGSLSHYLYEATDVSGSLVYNENTGPWQRILYPGSTIGFGDSTPGGNNGLARMVSDASSMGFDVTPANPIQNANAVRFALGATRTGRPGFVEVALRVTDVPIDPDFDPPNGGNVDCGEVIGSDVAARGPNTSGKNNPWPSYVGTPQCVYLKLLFDLDVDQELALGNDVLTYTLDGKNLSLNDETNAVARLKYDSNKQSFQSATPAVSSGPVTCPDDSTKTCVYWNLGTLAPSDEYTIEAQFAVGGGGHTSNVMIANYQSDQLPAPGYSTQSISIVTGIALPQIALQHNDDTNNGASPLDPTLDFAAAGGTWSLDGQLFNEGTNEVTMNELTLHLPTGWSVNGDVTLDGTTLSCLAGCGTDTPTYDVSQSFVSGAGGELELDVDVPSGEPDGLYTIDAQIWAGQSGFGGDFESYFRELITIPVGAVRTQKPTLDCPIVSTQPSITGTSEADADISVDFNLLGRGTATADGSGNWESNDYGAFGEMYGGLEVSATAQAPGKLESERSDRCLVTAVRACSDGIDNDNDGLIDFPADPGCESLSDNDETDPPDPECSDGIDNNNDGNIDWPDDPSCASADDPTEDGVTECQDDVDNDADGLLDYDGDGNSGLIDPDCTDASDPTERTLMACQDGIDNDADGLIDFDGLGDPNLADPGCHSAFDDDETDIAVTPSDVKARLLVVFDTSGSMNWNTCNDTFTGGDGSNECMGGDVDCSTCNSDTCGNTLADDSRLFKVKEGISDVVAGFGEVEYGLMRFHQRDQSFECPGVNASAQSGGWQGGGAEPCGGGFNAGDLLVGFAPDNQYTMLGWMDHDDNYDGTPPSGLDFELRGTGTTPLAGALDSARTYLQDVQADDTRVECRPYRVILVTDGQETCGGDPEAAASALDSMGVPVNVIGFATNDQSIVDGLDAIAFSGGTGEAIVVDDEATLSTAMASIVTETILVEVCNDLDDDCDGFVDEDFENKGDTCDNGEDGICFEEGTYVCTADGLGTECNAPSGTPETEVCNNLDDDCDGKVDEGLTGCDCVAQDEICNGADDDCDGAVDEAPLPGVGDSCGLSIGECEPGSLICSNGELVCDGGVEPTTEVCNNLDDDCDSFVDEYFEECYTFSTGCEVGVGCEGQCETGAITCVNGSETGCVGEVGPESEVCNGIDDDCDGSIDEPWPELGTTCDNGQQGACFQEGTWVCTQDETGIECTAPTVDPGTETCNGVDDDCDGIIDEDLGAPIGDTCGGGADCTQGTLQCVNGEVVCEGSEGAEPETCNGIDDDCDSVIDEEPLPGTGGDCTDPGFEQIGDTGECEFGTEVCIAGGIVCEDYVGPTPEICNGLDDDCDGEADDFAECPSEDNLCHEGECIEPCEMGEFPCSFGFTCETIDGEDFCVPDPCLDVSCQQGESCDSDTGECVDLCEGVMCDPAETCQNGFCVDCFVTGCGDGERCELNDDGVGVCEPDPCAGVDCNDDEFCREGECVGVSCDPPCSDGEYCADGTCQSDMCEGVDCPRNTECRPSDGECISINNCEGVNCQQGQVCNPGDGTCIDDPCEGVDCPRGHLCEVNLDGQATCTPNSIDDPGEDIYAAGSGCACNTDGGAPTGSHLLILLAGLYLLRRRGRSPAVLNLSGRRTPSKQ